MENITKICTKCGEEKDFADFTKDKRNKDGMGASCLKCFAIRSRELSPKRKVKKAEQGKLYREVNKDKIKERIKKWYAVNKSKYKGQSTRWYKENPEKAKKIYKRRDQKVLGTPKGRISCMMSNRIRNSMRKGMKANHHWEDLVSFTVDQLKMHLEKQFTPEMNWENYGSYWHIDHKIPISVFNYEAPDDIDFKRCWSLKNLQPLEAIKNISKGARIETPFQPSLMM